MNASGIENIEGVESQEPLPEYDCHIPAEIVVGHGRERKHYPVSVEKISDDHIRVHGHGIPENDEHLKVHFKIPPEVMPEEYGKIRVHSKVLIKEHHGDDYELEFSETLSHHLKHTVWLTVKFFAVVLAVLATLAILAIKYENLYFFW